MSPQAIVDTSLEKGLSLIGITDHNATRQCAIVSEIAKEKGLSVLCGVELTTREEVHLLAWFESVEVASAFQGWIDIHLQKIPNNPEFFGYQVVVDRQEKVVYEEPYLLITALDTDIIETASAVHAFGGLVAAAHVDKRKNSLFSQLGVMPAHLVLDAVEASAAEHETLVRHYLGDYPAPIVCGSDAHDAKDIGRSFSCFHMETPTFHEVRLALASAGGRGVCL